MKYKTIVSLIVFTYFLNFAWESAQAPLYRAYEGFSQNWFVCAKAALGDLVMVGVIFVFMAVVFGGLWMDNLNPKQLIALFLIGGVLAVIVEKWGLISGRWQYNEMPIIPFLNIGLTPVLQMLVIPPVIISFRKVISR